MSASDAKSGPANDTAWLDQVLGCLSPPFTFRNGGSAITAGRGKDGRPCQQSAAVTPPSTGQAKTGQHR